jgi:hypothetical protein
MFGSGQRAIAFALIFDRGRRGPMGEICLATCDKSADWLTPIVAHRGTKGLLDGICFFVQQSSISGDYVLEEIVPFLV